MTDLGQSGRALQAQSRKPSSDGLEPVVPTFGLLQSTRALEGGLANAPIDAAHAFRAMLDAMARPGTIQQVGVAAPPTPLGAAAGALLLTLCDPDTPLWLAPSVATDDVRAWIAFHSGAPILGRGEARFAFGAWEDMQPLSSFAIGTADYPDRSATLIVEVEALEGDARLTGPGVEAVARLAVPDGEAFRQNAALFPLGLDFFLTCGDRLAAIPRTTRVLGASDSAPAREAR
ncbi:MAG: phosphonate C-P lyase system protein PhnH [Pseudomonadota bacterium]